MIIAQSMLSIELIHIMQNCMHYLESKVGGRCMLSMTDKRGL